MEYIKKILFYFLLPVLFGCGSSESPDAPSSVRTPEWVKEKITQPVPSWGSSNRLILPVNINQIVLGPLGGIGGFGSHQGGHIEGLDHVWLEVENGIPVRSWAAGKVTKIEDMGAEFFITIEYAGGLIGKHMEVKTVLVSLGQTVKAGDPIAYGITYSSFQSAEFCLNDKNRNDGVTAGSDGSYVSPFDYLRPDLKDSLEQIYIKKVIQPYLSSGKDAGNNHSYEPYLTNPVLFHKQYRGTIAGEWLLNSKWLPGGYPDILVFLDIDNDYFKGKRILAADDQSQGQTIFDGLWDADTLLHRFTFTSNNLKFYGIYELNETKERASLKIEYRNDTYPSSFSSNAGIYIERAALPRRVDAEQIGVY